MNNAPKRLNIQAALDRVRQGQWNLGIQRVPNAFDDGDLQQFLVKTGEELVPGFVLDKDNEKQYLNIRRWADGRSFTCTDPQLGIDIQGDPCKGLYLCGPTGSGKSVLIQVLQAYVSALSLEMIVREQRGRFAWKAYRADWICNDIARTGDFSPYFNEPILCINDIGSEPLETMYMGNRLSVIRTILEYRGDRDNRMTILTSNLRISPKTQSQKGIADIYGPRVYSRLIGRCNYFELTGKDRRIIKK